MPSLSARPLGATGTTPPALLAGRVAADGARPLLTAYDDGTGERVELSATTLANWVSKTANLLQDELGAQRGTAVRLDLPAHWQAAVWVLAAWSLGALVSAPGEPDATPPDVAVAGPDGLAAALTSGAAEVVAVSLRPLGGVWPGPLPVGVLDYATAVPAQGDRFAPYQPVGPALPALTSGRALHTHGGLVDLARESAAGLGVGPGDRLLTGSAPTSLRGALEVVVLPLVTGASVVLVRPGTAPLEPDADARRAAAERVTHDLRRPDASAPRGTA